MTSAGASTSRIPRGSSGRIGTARSTLGLDSPGAARAQSDMGRPPTPVAVTQTRMGRRSFARTRAGPEPFLAPRRLSTGSTVSPPRAASGRGLRFNPVRRRGSGAEQDGAADGALAHDDLRVSDREPVV
jgi:hypothetical protein